MTKLRLESMTYFPPNYDPMLTELLSLLSKSLTYLHWFSMLILLQTCMLLQSMLEVWLDTDRALERWSKIALYCGSVQMPSPKPDRSVQVHLKTHFMGWDMLSVLMHACRLHIYTQNSAVASSVHWSCNSSKMYQRSIGRADVSPWSPWRWPRWYWFDSCWYLGR